MYLTSKLHNGPISLSGLVLSLSETALTHRSQTRSQIFIIIIIILKEKGVMQMYTLAEFFKCDILAKLSQLDFCKPTRLHHSFFN